MSCYEFEGQSVVVTGAGAGIGRAAALQFAEERARVLVADRDEEAARQVVKTIQHAGGTARAVVGDLRDQGTVEEIVGTSVGFFGGLDVLVHGDRATDSASGPSDGDATDWRRVLEVGLVAPYALTLAALPHMLAGERGAIVFTCSEGGLRGGSAPAARTAAEHGLVGLVRSLAVTYGSHGIRTNAIATADALAGIPVSHPSAAPGTDPGHPRIGRSALIARPDNQATTIVFLASDAACHVNGTLLPVDNGWSAV
ncbi:SDR family oxidoreductase [Streptomyces humi]